MNPARLPYFILNFCRSYHQPGAAFVRDPYARDWATLGLPSNSNLQQVRVVFLELSKRFHPDSNSSEASVQRFQEIDKAYKNLQAKFAEEKLNPENPSEAIVFDDEDPEGQEVPDIKHTAPQHRHYLSYDGFGIGTPSQREKLYQKDRASRAAQNVLEYNLEKLAQSGNTEEKALVKNSREAKKVKTGLGIERLVEDMIQESMAKGDFKNLKGSGKPLSHDSVNQNPFIDFTTHKLNQVLLENGFVPEWILLEKEIREEVKIFRSKLSRVRSSFGPDLNVNDFNNWEHFLKTLVPEMKNINLKIAKYNLVVPILQKQLIGLDMGRESERALREYVPNPDVAFQFNQNPKPMNHQSSRTPTPSFIELLTSLLKW